MLSESLTLKNAINKIIKPLIYISISILITRYTPPVSYAIGTISDLAYQLLSPNGLGLVDYAQEWGSDNVSFFTSLFLILLMAFLISFISNKIHSIFKKPIDK